MALTPELLLELDHPEHLPTLFGLFDSHLQPLERAFGVTVLNREGQLKLVGDAASLPLAQRSIQALLLLIAQGTALTEQTVRYVIGLADDAEALQKLESMTENSVCVAANGRPVQARTLGQSRYVEAIRTHTISFGVGPAGTGKTYLAVAMAVTAFRKKEVERIVLTRPAIEAGEKLGFLPGDLQQKIHPYLRPLFDALQQLFGAELFARMQERGTLEIAPLAYMRGRTLENCFVILDEAQNTSAEQMKMFLTRLGTGSKMVITGDVTQIDLPKTYASGLVHAIQLLKDVDDIAILRFSERDVVRHRLVQTIIKAYEKEERGRSYGKAT